MQHQRNALVIDGRTLRVDDVVDVASGGADVRLAGSAAVRIEQSRELKQTLIDSGQPIYGVTTGFGDSVTRQISSAKTAELQRNLVRYHLNGTGPIAAADVVRATMLIRANCLARGASGIRVAVIDGLLALVNHDALPLIPERGSVGASGDLVPLCYVASAVFGEGRVTYRNETRPATDVWTEIGLPPVVPEAKDGLALINGTSFSAAFAVLALAEAERLVRLAELCTAMASEALLGNSGHFAPFIHAQKPHPGQQASAAAVRELLADSGLALDHGRVVGLTDRIGERGYLKQERSIQDRYSVRCAPHVIGMVRDTAAWVRQWVEIEINSTNDNPLFDAGDGIVHSGGNFYGGHLVQAMDALKVGVANLADLLDRQLELVVDEKFNNGLTPNLVPRFAAGDWRAGLHHGFKGMQIACSAIAAEALKGTMPASVFSRSTEAHNQDKVSMAPIAGRDARAVAALVEEVVAIHLLAMCQALDLRGVENAAPLTRGIHALIRSRVPELTDDRAMDGDIAVVLHLVRSGALVAELDRLRGRGQAIPVG
ncbi:HAL/PAL/TAL family ammonia-lyase [Cryptosporangium aurantiacum]|uniref:Histidine ammonia-lyase/phenylalanine ammonia-lyase n=1 Tax=Cryptosporangium aurantiacum TaxID=134849 RepID=A0A1M7RLW9_9ACTN|nr:aromatic amino acid ammonia-lyase [Cryptosporangium aurantiacum]SHN47313.1 histidine ammonia-lyase/phenylalanine ammonia-lyase [Cryptosporangium aurantiacum]